jgi:hypothetical protein
MSWRVTSLLFLLCLLCLPQRMSAGERLNAELVEDIRLRCLGPALKPGRIGHIAIDPRNRSTWYLATASSGLWKTTTRGTTWTPIFDTYGAASIDEVRISQNNPDIIWVGTGEEDGRNSSTWGDGVYKSTDGGAIRLSRATTESP